MNILVPTDFSEYALYAFNVACQIAKKTESHLHLYNCINIPDDWEELHVASKLEDQLNNNKVIEARNKLILLRDKAQNEGVKSTIHYTGGEFLENIDKIIDKAKIELIVIGSHGTSGKQEWYIGSNSQKVIRKTRINTLIIKHPIKNFNPDKVAFVSGLNLDDQHAFKSLLKFLESFEPSEVHVASVDTSAWFSQPPIVMLEALKDFGNIADNYKCTTHFYKDKSIQSGIRNFLEEHKIDLVSISYRSRNPIKRIFLGSNVEMLVNHTDCPVLCIND